MVLLSLIVALTGTPLRLMEAAGDLARSLEELGEEGEDDGWDIEQADGGVGDDSGEALRADVAHAPDLAATGDLTLSPPDLMIARTWTCARRERGNPARAPAGPPSRRCARLQCFRC
jgi:hypothetical protein